MGIGRVTIWVIGVINLLTNSPSPPSTVDERPQTLEPPGLGTRVNCGRAGTPGGAR